MEETAYDIVADPATPKVGDQIRIGRFLGPTGTVRKVQAVEWVDGVNYFRPQNTVFNHKEQPDKEGYDEVIIVPSKKDGAFWLCWMEMQRIIPEEFLEGLYAIPRDKSVDGCTYIMEKGMNIHTDYDAWSRIFRLVDLSRLRASTTVSFFVTAKGNRKHIEGFNDFVDRVVAHYGQEEMTPEEAESLFGKWRSKPDDDDRPNPFFGF